MKKYIENFDNIYSIDINGNIKNELSGKYLTPNYSGDYPRIKLSKNNKDYVFSIHRLVAENFLSNTENKMIINHIDGDKKNFKLSNLEFCTHKENMKHAFETGLKKIRYRGSYKLSEKDVVDIYKSNKSLYELSIEYNITKSSVHNIKNNKTWKNLDKNSTNLSTLKKISDNNLFDYEYSKEIINHPNYKIDINGYVINIKTNKLVKSVLDKNYFRINLNKKNYFIHRLVAIHFIPNEDKNRNIVNHIDNITTNNNVNNLEWCNTSENANHSIKNNFREIVKGENIGTSKLTSEDVLSIFKSTKSYSKISIEFSISIATISMIKNKNIFLCQTNILWASFASSWIPIKTDTGWKWLTRIREVLVSDDGKKYRVFIRKEYRYRKSFINQLNN